MDSMTGAAYDVPLTMDGQPEPQPEYNPTPEPQVGETDVVGMPIETLIDTEIISMVTSRQAASQQWRDELRLEWDEATDNYEQVYDATAKEDWQATTFQPLIPTHVERATASLHNMSMGPETPVEFKARVGANEDQINKTNDLVQHDLERGQFKVSWTDFLRTNALYGTAIGKVGYVKETATVMVKKRQRSLMGGAMNAMAKMFGFDEVKPAESFQPETMVVRDFAQFKNCDIYKIYPQPHIEDFTKDTWVIEKFKITNKELVEGAMNEDEFYRLENVTPELLMSGSQAPNHDPQTQQKRMAMMDRDVPMPFLEPDQEHEGLEYWGPVPLWFLEPEARQDPVKKYLTVNAWLWVIDGKFVVRKRLNPYRDATPPYVKGNYIRRMGLFYGIGIGKMLSGLQVEKNEIRNTRQDNINLLLNKIMAINKDKVSKEDVSRLISAPGAIWPFTGIDDIRKSVTTIDMPDITQDSWRGSAEVDREAQEATDVIKTTQTIGAGEDQAGNGTFRGQMLNRQQANERFMLIARILELVGLNAAIDKIYQRIYQYKSFEQIDVILGTERAKDFELIPPEKINEVASLVSLGALTNENKGVKLAQMRDFYVLFEKNEWMKKIEFARKMYRLMGTGSDPDEIIWTDEEVKQFNEMKRQMMSELGGEPGSPVGANPMDTPPSGLGAPPTSPIAGNVPGPTDGMPRESMPARGPGAATIDGMGRPAA